MGTLQTVLGRLSALALLVGCGGGPTPADVFGTTRGEDRSQSLAEASERLRAHRRAEAPGLAVGVALGRHELTVMGDRGRLHFSLDERVDSGPRVAGPLVLFTSLGQLIALDAKTGRQTWTRPARGVALTAADDDGELTVVALREHAGPYHRIMAVLRNGSVARQIEDQSRVYGVAVERSLAWVARGALGTSLVDLVGGAEVGYFEGVRAGAIWFANGRVVALTQDLGQLTLSADYSTFHPILPGRPHLGCERFAIGSADGKSDCVFAIDPTRLGLGQPYLAFASGTVWGVVHWTTGRLQWLRTRPASVLSLHVRDGSLVACDADGVVESVALTTGHRRARASFSVPLQHCELGGDLWGQGSGRADAGPGDDLSASIVTALLSRETTFSPFDGWLIHQLSGLPDAREALVRVARRATTEALRAAATERLRTLRDAPKAPGN